VIRTFSGAHPFRPQCLVDAYVESGDPFEPEDEESVRRDAAIDVAELADKTRREVLNEENDPKLQATAQSASRVGGSHVDVVALRGQFGSRRAAS
jgi:hypothetical protein